MVKLLKIFVVFLFLCSCDNKSVSPLSIETSDGIVTYNVELASTIEQLQTGLMNRDKLAADSGMLFDLSVVDGQNTAMWMKDTKISLDMLFLTPEGFIFWIKENTQPYSEELIIPPFPAAAVLEINAGEAKKNGFTIGQIVKHPIFPIKKQKPATEENAVSTDASENTTDNAEATVPEVIEEEILVEQVTVDSSSDVDISEPETEASASNLSEEETIDTVESSQAESPKEETEAEKAESEKESKTE